MYKLQNQLPPEAQEAIFTQPLDQLLTQSPEFLRTWIICTNKYMKQQLKAAKMHKTQDTGYMFLFQTMLSCSK